MIVNNALSLSAKAPEQAELKKAAQQFEAIFVRQMLAAARKANLSEGLFDNSAVEQFQSMQDSKFADIVTENGGLGLAKTIEQQLSSIVGGQKK